MLRAKSLLILMLTLMLSSGVLILSCRSGEGPITAEVVIIHSANLPLDPNDPLWKAAPKHLAKLIPQDLVEPRLIKASTSEVQVKAVSNGANVAFRLEWLDDVKNDLPGPAKFIDGCAVQVPSKIAANVPDPQMGQTGQSVEITFWRADWQAIMNGRKDSIKELYPNAAIDHYPFEAKPLEKDSVAQSEMQKRYAPARTLGNNREGPRDSAVEELIAEGPGSLSPAPNPTGAKGKGLYNGKVWSVVILRSLPKDLSPNTRSQIAFAIWEGGHKEVGARKMRSGWVPLLMKAEGELSKNAH
ncbi:MAG: putative nitrate reductase subunit gamma [bacterium]|nr:MAG: putative nitrate reductase subunit gamma [bacterium]